MKTFYSIIYLPINLTTNERISIGIILADENHSFIKFSDKKLTSIKGLLNPNVYKFVSSYIKSLENIQETPINFNLYRNKINEKEYLNYLVRYSNNTIQLTPPERIDLPTNDNVLSKLFKKFIYDEDNLSRPELKLEIIKESKITNRVITEFQNNIKQNVNLNITLKPEIVKNLFTPVDVDFIGKNGIVVSGKDFDFTKSKSILQNEISKFVSLKTAMDHNNKSSSKFYFISQEPPKSQKSIHKLWVEVYESNIFKYTDYDDIKEIEDYIHSHKVKPLYLNDN